MCVQAVGNFHVTTPAMKACQTPQVLQEVLTGYMKTNVQAILENITPKVGWAGGRLPVLPPAQLSGCVVVPGSM